jgi:hypothetical protein
MAYTDAQKVDLLYKKLSGVAKTDTSTNKGASNEANSSPMLIRLENSWTKSGEVPSTPPGSPNSIISVYQNATAVQCNADITTVATGSVYPTWQTKLTDWIPPEFGSGYFIKVYADSAGVSNVVATGTQLSDAGIAGVGEWFFDYQAGILNFVGSSPIPAALTSSKVIYITGYRYTGEKGLITINGGSF